MELSDITPNITEREIEIAMHQFLCLKRMEKCYNELENLISLNLADNEYKKIKLKKWTNSFYKAKETYLAFSKKPKIRKEEIIKELKELQQKIKTKKLSDKGYEKQMSKIMEKEKLTERTGYLIHAKFVLLHPENEDYREMFYKKTLDELIDIKEKWDEKYNDFCKKIEDYVQ